MTGLLVALLCTNLNLEEPKELDACKHAGNASASQLGVDQKLNRLQKNVERYADQKAKEYLSEEVAFVAATGYTIFITQKLVYSVPMRPWVDATTVEVKHDEVNFLLKWNF